MPKAMNNPQITAIVDEIEAVLRRQGDCHRQLAQLIARKREAIRTGQIQVIPQICQDEHPLIQRVAELEKRRLALVGTLTELVDPSRGEPLTISDMAGLVETEQADRLTGLAAQVREIVENVRRESSVVRSAAEQLSVHMAGLMQVVQGTLSRAGVYGRQGRLAVGVPVQTALDLKS